MQLSIERRAFLSQEHKQLGWIEIPGSAPPEIRNRILEYRDANIDRPFRPRQSATSRIAQCKAILQEHEAYTQAQNDGDRDQARLRVAIAKLM